MRENPEGRDVWRIIATYVFIPLCSCLAGSTATYFGQVRQIQEKQIEYGQRISASERALIAEQIDRKNADETKDKVTEARVTNILRNMEQVIAQNTEIVKQNTEVIALIKIQRNMTP